MQETSGSSFINFFGTSLSSTGTPVRFGVPGVVAGVNAGLMMEGGTPPQPPTSPMDRRESDLDRDLGLPDIGDVTWDVA
jgi:hypothetical protein